MVCLILIGRKCYNSFLCTIMVWHRWRAKISTRHKSYFHIKYSNYFFLIKNLLKFNKAKVLQLGWSNYKHKHRLDNKWIESRPAKKDLGCWLKRNSTWAGNEYLQPKMPTLSWAASTESWPAGQGHWFSASTLLSWNPIWSTVFSWGPPSITHWPITRGLEDGHEDDQKSGAVKTVWGNWGC